MKYTVTIYTAPDISGWFWKIRQENEYSAWSGYVFTYLGARWAVKRTLNKINRYHQQFEEYEVEL